MIQRYIGYSADKFGSVIGFKILISICSMFLHVDFESTNWTVAVEHNKCRGVTLSFYCTVYHNTGSNYYFQILVGNKPKPLSAIKR